VQRDVPVGTIAVYAGSILDIPSTYRLCDGTNGTPDLRNKFVVGANDTYAVDAVGGNINHKHDYTDNGHQHSLPVGANIAGGPHVSPSIGVHFISDETDNQDGRPPYYSLAYIMYAGRPI